MTHTINTPIAMPDGTTTPAHIYWNEPCQEYRIKIQYPKVGRSHFHSLVNYIHSLWDEQYPTLDKAMQLQLRGTVTYHPLTNPITL